MRGIVAAFSIVAALLLIAASMAMNFVFWRGQGADEETARVLGAASIGVDIFKAMLPLASKRFTGPTLRPCTRALILARDGARSFQP